MTVIRCSFCGLVQWARVSGICAKCGARAFSLIEIPLCFHPTTSDDHPALALRVGPALRAMRLRQGRTQASVSSKARVPRTSLSRFESGTCTPSLPTLGRILTALGAESLYIRCGNQPQPRNDFVE